MLVHAIQFLRMLRFMLVVLSGIRDGVQFRPLGLALVAALYVAGTALANLTPASWAYHAEQARRREERRNAKRKSLSEWRRGS